MSYLGVYILVGITVFSTVIYIGYKCLIKINFAEDAKKELQK
jgi:hypothetical protein